jgi:DNA-binding SARP family transcriptional activator
MATHPEHAIQLFGGAVITEAGRPLGGAAAHRHRIALLALLAGSSMPVSRDKLIAMLWPERDSDAGRNLLKVAVHEVRKILGDAAIISTGDLLSLDGSIVQCDLLAFEKAIAARDYRAAAEQYGGPFLDGFHVKSAAEFERWADSQRSRLAGMYVAALERLGADAERGGDNHQAVHWWKRLAAEDPLRSDVALRLMKAMDASGDRTGALRHADIHATLRSRDFSLEPEPAVAAYARELAVAPDTAVLVPPRPRHDLNPDSPPVPSADGHLYTRRPFSARMFAIGAALMGLLVIATLVIGKMVNARDEVSLAPGQEALIVSPFRVVSPDSSLDYLSDGMREMLVARFGNDGPLSVAPSAPNRPLELANAIQTARAFGGTLVLLGDAIAGQGTVDLSAVIYRVIDGSVAGRASRTVQRNASVAEVADTIAAELMARVVGEPEDRTAVLRSRSLAALRPYLAGQAAYRRGGYVRAESLFARALDADSTFALAGLGLALSNSWNTINEHYGIGRDAALRGINAMPPRDRDFTRAFFGADPALGRPRPAPVYLQAWEEVIHKWPDYAEAWYDVGDRYYHFGGLSGIADPLDPARTAFRRATTLDPKLVAPLHHLIEIYASRGERDEAREAGEQYFAANPAIARNATAIGWELATVTGDAQWLGRLRARFDSMPLSDLQRIAWVTQANGWPANDAEQAIASMERRAGPTYEKEHAALLRYAFELNRGNAKGALDAAGRLESQLPDQPITALWEMYAVLFGGADSTGAGRLLSALDPFASAPFSGNPDRQSRQVEARCLAADWRLQTGNVDAVRNDLAAIRDAEKSLARAELPLREARTCAAALEASIAVRSGSGSASRALATLDTLVLSERIPPRMSLTAAAITSARLHQQLGELRLALAASRWREHYTGDPVFLSTQLELESDLAHRLGDSVSAARAAAARDALRR